MAKSFADYMVQRQLPRADPCSGVLKCVFDISKSDDEKRMAFGWASVAERVDGETVVDWQEDIIDINELEAAAYDFVQFYREGSDMHERGGLNIAVLIESMVFTTDKMRLIGIAEGEIPCGWWVGFKVIDDVVWEKVKDGTYTMFSIEGEAVREEV